MKWNVYTNGGYLKYDSGKFRIESFIENGSAYDNREDAIAALDAYDACWAETFYPRKYHRSNSYHFVVRVLDDLSLDPRTGRWTVNGFECSKNTEYGTDGLSRKSMKKFIGGLVINNVEHITRRVIF